MGATLNLTVKNVPNSTNISANTSKIDIELYISTTSGTNNQVGDTSGSVKLNGTVIAKLDGKKVGRDTRTKLYSGRHTVRHNSTGGGTAEVKASFDVNTSTRWVYATKSVSLPSIPRASKIGDLKSFVIEERFGCPVTKYSSAFTDTLTVSVGGHVIRTREDYPSDYQLAFFVDEILKCYKNMSQSKNSDTFTFKLTTKDSSGKVIGTDTKTTTGYARGTARSGSNRRMIPWVRVAGKWYRAVSFVSEGGKPYRGR